MSLSWGKQTMGHVIVYKKCGDLIISYKIMKQGADPWNTSLFQYEWREGKSLYIYIKGNDPRSQKWV